MKVIISDCTVYRKDAVKVVIHFPSQKEFDNKTKSLLCYMYFMVSQGTYTLDVLSNHVPLRAHNYVNYDTTCCINC